MLKCLIGKKNILYNTNKHYKMFFIFIAIKTTKRQIKTVSKENSSADGERQRSCKIIAQRWQKRVNI